MQRSSTKERGLIKVQILALTLALSRRRGNKTPSPFDPDRQVWEVETEHAAIQVGTDGDVYRNAIVTRAVDAETGELLYFKIPAPVKDFIPGKHRFNSQPQ